ncbi:hypothetical protein WJX79_009986 [Trebouxia sp. C0005]
MVPVRVRADLTSVLQGLRENIAPKQGAARPKVASCLTWLPFLSVPTLLVVMMYGLLDSATLGAALSALKRAVQATLPDLALTQISPMVLMIAAVCAAFAETACGPSHKHNSTGMGAVSKALLKLAGVKLVLYNGAALLFAAAIHALVTSPMVWGMCKEVCSQMGPVPIEIQAFLMTLAFAGCCTLLEESSSVTSGMGHQVRTTAASLMQAAMVLLKVTCYTLIPMLSADIMASVRKTLLLRTAQVHLQVLVLENRLLELLPAFLMVATSSALLIESCFVLFSKKMSPHTDGASMLANAVKATCFQPGHKQALVVGAKLVLYNAYLKSQPQVPAAWDTRSGQLLATWWRLPLSSSK